MNYGTLEVAIVQRLNNGFAGLTEVLNGVNVSDRYEAALMPETNEQFQQFINSFTKARVAVEFKDTTPAPSVSLGAVCQEETVRFRLSYEYRKLRGEGGLYEMMRLTKLFLMGFALPSCGPLSFDKYGMLEFEQNSFQPYFEFVCVLQNVQPVNTFPDDQPLGGNVGPIFTDPALSDEFYKEQFG